VARNGIGRLSGSIQHPAHGVAITGARKWFLTLEKKIEVHQTRFNRARQPTGMAGHASPYIRIPFAYDRGPGVGVDLSLQERLDELFKDKHNAERVDIGFKRVDTSFADKEAVTKWRKEIRKNRAIEKAAREGTLEVDLSKVKEEWVTSGQQFEAIYKAAEYYGIYEDLFREGYFYPCVNLDIAYPIQNEMMAPVYRGNVIKPAEAANPPEISWNSREDDIWCIVLTAPDSHLSLDGQEYVHLMIGNIKGSDLGSGHEVFSYLQPFPPYGSGYHRFVFTLYKQDEIMDFGHFTNDKATTVLSERTFNTYDFYKQNEDKMTPVGLAFFQSDWDSSLRNFFHDTLNMKEPRYEYEFQTPFVKPWDKWEVRDKSKSFNEFLDEHRDPKDIEKEVLLKKLEHTHPYFGDTEGHIKYPLAHIEDYQEVLPAPIGHKPLLSRQSKKVPSWKMKEIMKEKMKKGYYSSTDHSQLRRDPVMSS